MTIWEKKVQFILKNYDINFVENNGSKHKDLIVDDFRFRFARTNKNGSIYYKCRHKDPATKKACSASITLKSENLEDGVVRI
jgi:hypothetical protein